MAKLLLNLVVLILTLATCSEPAAVVPFSDLFLGITVGMDSSAGMDAAGSAGWTIDTSSLFSASGRFDFVPPQGEGRLGLSIDSGQVVLITRQWWFFPPDSASGWRLYDSLRTMLDRSFPKLDAGHEFWIIDVKPDTIYMFIDVNRPLSEGGRFHVAAGVGSRL
jgi:hypothetical protein